MLLDKDGNDITQAPEPTRHTFGQFTVPADCHIKGFSSLPVENDAPKIWELDMRRRFKPAT